MGPTQDFIHNIRKIEHLLFENDKLDDACTSFVNYVTPEMENHPYSNITKGLLVVFVLDLEDNC